MLDIEAIRKVDRAGFWEAYMKWPDAARRALSQSLEVPPRREVSLIVLAGMGGSGIACSVIADWLRPNSSLPVMVVKDFQLPKCVGRRSLVVVLSLSGETKEMLSVFNEAVGRGCSVVTVSSGGELESASRRLGVPHNKVEKLMAPRASLPGLLYVPLRILSELGLAPSLKSEVEESIGVLEKTVAEVSPSVAFSRNPAKKVAKLLRETRPVVYSSGRHESVAYGFKASMNENAKTDVQVGAYPELFHNEIETWRSRSGRAVLLLRHSDESRELRRRIHRMKAIVAASGCRVVEVWCRDGLLASLVRWALLLDMISIYVAVLKGREPLPTKLLNRMREI